jgi:hypothetical protein
LNRLIPSPDHPVGHDRRLQAIAGDFQNIVRGGEAFELDASRGSISAPVTRLHASSLEAGRALHPVDRERSD